MSATNTHETSTQAPRSKSYQSTWCGVGLLILHTPQLFGGYDHIEIRSDDCAILPITETGYRSYFLLPEELAEFHDAETFVLAWLDHEARTRAWNTIKEKSAQLSLF